jgi:16S rRNA G1207 methylase RsmC
VEEKDGELRIVKEAFAEIHESLNAAFGSIIAEVRKKHRQIRDFL